MLTVACVWVHGHLPYPVEYVTRLHAMAKRYISRPFEFVCVTDEPSKVPDGVRPIAVPRPAAGVKGWWSKLEIFSASHGLSGRVLYLDLDTLIVADLEPVISFPAPFALVPHAGTFEGKGGLRVVKKFNSSVMVLDGGTLDYIYKAFTPAMAETLWGDQDAIGLLAPDAAVFPAAWCPRISEFTWPNVPGGAKVVLMKRPKNAVAAKTLKGFAEAWG